jgi:hypothetical protein
MFNSFATTITGANTDDLPNRADLVWRMLLHGLAGTPVSTRSVPAMARDRRGGW